MKKLLNTLYITNSNAYLSKDGENIVIKIDEKEVKRFPIHILEGIVCFSYNGASPGVVRLCSQNGINLAYISPSGKFNGRFIGVTSGNVLLRREQYRIADDERKVAISRNMIRGKLINSRKILLRGVRDHKNKVDINKLEKICDSLKLQIENVKELDNNDSIRGIEGESARKYFNGLNELILKNKDVFFMKERSKRPPLDCLNAVLSYLYSLLTYETQSSLETVGLDSYVGFLHTDRPGRASLALDLMEELRAYMVDRLVINLINYEILKEIHFEKKENGSVLLNEEGRKLIISEWQKRKQKEVEHKFIKEKIEIGLIPYVQALLLSRVIRGDLSEYPPFLIN